MSMFNPIKEGTWWISSKSDPRWDTSGRGHVGGFVCPQEVLDATSRLESELGERPDDLEFGYMKD